MESSKAPTRSIHRRGFTLIEALMASGVLLMIVVAVTSALTAGQQNAFEAHQRIAGTLAAEELIGRIIVEDYADLPSWNGFSEAVGSIVDMDGQPLPESFSALGRNVRVTTTMQELPDINVDVRGRTVRVQAVDNSGRVIADLSRFVPEPQ